MAVKGGTLVRIIAESLDVIDDTIVGPDDEFLEPTAQQDAELAAKITAIFEAHGVDVPDKLEKIIKALPAILSLIGG